MWELSAKDSAQCPGHRHAVTFSMLLTGVNVRYQGARPEGVRREDILEEEEKSQSGKFGD